jgi:secreted trypsin-like serine protease
MLRHARLGPVLLLLLALMVSTAGAVSADDSPAAATQGEELDPRIVGGTEVDPPGKYPFIVAVVFSSEPDTYWGQYCGGALIDPWWVLTAGHCVAFADGGKPWKIDVVIGRHDLFFGTDGERIGVADIYRHPGYNRITLANDIALLRLERPAALGSPIALATPANASLFEPGDLATVIGWGATREPAPAPTYPYALHEVDVPIVSDADCAAAYGSDFILPDQICAGDLADGGVDSCYGDSGGPLFVDSVGGTYLQVGIVSTGNDCALPGYPGIYTRTATYAGWVAGVMAANPLPTCFGRTATLLGSSGDDVLVGTEGDDVIVARGGADTITGLGGNDFICAGPGNDWVDAGSGDDAVSAGEGDDYVLGGTGNDYIGGNTGRDRLFGGDGHDRIFGSSGSDLMLGEAGNDLLYGGPDADRLYGGAGDDTLAGLSGDDIISGGPGNDKLMGDEGFDVLRGGLGIDTCSTGEDVVCEFLKLDLKTPL